VQAVSEKEMELGSQGERKTTAVEQEPLSESTNYTKRENKVAAKQRTQAEMTGRVKKIAQP